MITLEVWHKTLSNERELADGRRRQEHDRHLHDAIALTKRRVPTRRGPLQRAWHAAIGGLQRRATWSPLRPDAREECATAANDVFLTYQASDY